MSWFEKLYGKKPEEIGKKFPKIARFKEINGKEIIFDEDDVRIVSVIGKERGVINIILDGEERSLFLTRMGLAKEVALLQQKVGSLKGVKVKVEELEKRGSFIPYRLTLIQEQLKPEEKKEPEPVKKRVITGVVPSTEPLEKVVEKELIKKENLDEIKEFIETIFSFYDEVPKDYFEKRIKEKFPDYTPADILASCKDLIVEEAGKIKRKS
jgi:hypothetical protein